MIQARRRGFCPSIFTPMETGDGLIVRLAPARRYFRPGELRAIAAAAEECGNGLMEVTTRGSLQVRGLSKTSARVFEGRIADAGIAFQTGVPVAVNPLAGVDDREIRDPSPLADDIARRLAATDLPERLSPKTSVIVDGGGVFSLSHLIGDIRLKAVRTPGGAKWRLFAGGREAASRTLGSTEKPDIAVDAVITLLEQLALRGGAARGRDLDERDVAHLAQSGLDRAPETNGAGKAQSPVGQFALKSGAVALGLGLAFGTARAGDIQELARRVEDAGARRIWLAPGRGLLIAELDAGAAENLRTAAQKLGLIGDPADPRLSVVTCAGAPACGSGHFATHPIAARIAETYADRLGGDVRVQISGCDKRCPCSGTATVEIVGRSRGCDVSSRDVAETCIAADDLIGAVGRLLPPPIVDVINMRDENGKP